MYDYLVEKQLAYDSLGSSRLQTRPSRRWLFRSPSIGISISWEKRKSRISNSRRSGASWRVYRMFAFYSSSKTCFFIKKPENHFWATHRYSIIESNQALWWAAAMLWLRLQIGMALAQAKRADARNCQPGIIKEFFMVFPMAVKIWWL